MLLIKRVKHRWKTCRYVYKWVDWSPIYPRL